MAALLAGSGLPAVAAPVAAVTAQAAASSPPARRARASIHLGVGRRDGSSTIWVGQSIPIVVRAQFRDVEGVTLDGTPELQSDSVFTSDLGREPHQSTELVNGEEVLVATWKGTITPSTAGPLALSVELPVRLRYHEAVAQPAFRDPMDMDPLAGMDIDPSDPTSIQRLFRSFQQSFSHGFEQSMGRVHDDASTLKASTATMDVKPLPSAGQPAAFSGAVGRFELRASVGTTEVKASEPVTLRITVKGDGDLDRVHLVGVATSGDWKTYPTTSTKEAAPPAGRLGQKTFEQVLIPLHGGTLTIPSVVFSVFDPVAERYTTVETSPLELAVAGASEQAPAITSPAASDGVPTAVVRPDATSLQTPSPSSLVESPRSLALRLAPVLAALLAAAGVRLWRQRPDEERSLHRTLRQTAQRGRVAPFFDAARRLIVVHSAKRWGVAEDAVTPEFLRRHLGPTADPLVTVIASADALRFGRRDLKQADLWTVRSSIEESLRDSR